MNEWGWEVEENRTNGNSNCNAKAITTMAATTATPEKRERERENEGGTALGLGRECETFFSFSVPFCCLFIWSAFLLLSFPVISFLLLSSLSSPSSLPLLYPFSAPPFFTHLDPCSSFHISPSTLTLTLTPTHSSGPQPKSTLSHYLL